ncbi:MAG: hypothetical protein AB7R77_19135 [Ilumatobacteraceae bacterium]
MNAERAASTENGDLERVLAAGVEWVGREYARRVRDSLRKIGGKAEEGREPASGVLQGEWVTDIVFVGENLPDETYFDVIIAAIDEADGDADVLWCIADGPVDHLVGRDLVMGERLRSRRDDPHVDLMFTTMQLYLRGIGHLDGSWWADDFVAKPRRRPDR